MKETHDKQHFYLPQESDLLALAKRVATKLPSEANALGLAIALHGDLGAGKTTFVRGFLQGLGYTGTVKSPTYTLVESYDISGRQVHHMDWYRMQDAEQLEEMGIFEYFQGSSIILVEWPLARSATDFQADWNIQIDIRASGRDITITALSAAGKGWLHELS